MHVHNKTLIHSTINHCVPFNLINMHTLLEPYTFIHAVYVLATLPDDGSDSVIFFLELTSIEY